MVRFGVILLCSMLALHGCSSGAKIQPSLKLYVFDCGTLSFDSIEAFGIADDETDVRDLSVPCYVVEHERGRLLWEGGLPSKFAEAGGREGEGVRMRLDRTLGDQLADLGLGMDAFDYVAFSHMHFDHVGVANEVAGATLIIQKGEHDAAFADQVTLPGYDPSLYQGIRDARSVIVEGEHDVFGDGRVRILSAPGHTPGHQVLFLDLASTGPVLLAGDLYHFSASRDGRRVPAFNFDGPMTLESMDEVEAFVAETGADLWIGHDTASFERLNQAPLYYD